MSKPLVCSFLIASMLVPFSSRAASECSGNKAPACFVTGEIGVVNTVYSNVRIDLAGTDSSGNPIQIDGAIVAPNDPPSYRPSGNAGRTPVYYPLSQNNGLLFVMMPGQPDQPWEYREILRRAASSGYHALGINYWNAKPDAAMDLCAQDFLNTTTPSIDSCITGLFDGNFDNINAYTKAHRYTGVFPAPPCYLGGPECKGTTTGNLLNSGDPMRHRLRRTLAWLDANFPNQGWGAFAGAHHVDGTPDFDTAPYIDWSKVVLAGHSTGSKFATHVAKTVSLHRVVVLSGPHATFPGPSGTQCASAMLPNATQMSKMYFYDSTLDGAYGESVTCRNDMGFGNYGQADITLTASPFKNAQILKNGSDPKRPPANDCDIFSTGQAGHMSTAADCALTLHTVLGQQVIPTPTAVETFAAWDYLMRP